MLALEHPDYRVCKGACSTLPKGKQKTNKWKNSDGKNTNTSNAKLMN